MADAGRERGGLSDADEAELERLMAAYLDAAEEGRDIRDELVARAGRLGAELDARIELVRSMDALSRDLGGTKAPEAPRRFGKFTLLERLGHGGLGNVYRAHDTTLRRDVALKILRRTELLDRNQRDWIEHEALAVASLRHPGVVEVYEVGDVEGQSYVAMELLTGPTLEAVIAAWAAERAGRTGVAGSEKAVREAERLRPFPKRIECLARLAEALTHCHANGVLHRDIKPGNVLFDADGNPKWIDFGLAHREVPGEDTSLGVTEVWVGTLTNVAPEQAENSRTGANPRSDQFSFGLLAYQCFALQNPFVRDGRTAILDAVARAEVPPLARAEQAVTSDLALVIHHALEREPSARYARIADLEADLRNVLAHRPVSVHPPTLAHRVNLWRQRHRLALGVAARVLAAVALLWGAMSLSRGWRASRTIHEELDGLRFAEYEDASQLTLYDQLGDLRRRASELDSAPASGALFGGLSPSVDAAVRAWSQRLSELIARDEQRAQEQGLPLKEGIYPTLLAQEKSLCPDSPYNLDNRLRGQVVLPPSELDGHEWALSKLESVLPDVLDPDATPPGGEILFHAPRLSLFQSAKAESVLQPGFYRLMVWEHGAQHPLEETVFFVEGGWLPVQRITLTVPSRDALGDCLRVPTKKHELPGRGFLVIPSFALSKSRVTTREFRRFLSETHQSAPEFRADRAPDELAAVSYAWAMRYAAWLGGRLPSYAEMLVAATEGLLELPSPSPSSEGEFVQDFGGPDTLEPGWLNYAKKEVRLTSWKMLTGTTRPATYNSFRVAFSTDDPALYRRLADEPIEK